jgi:perosamine synthetase
MAAEMVRIPLSRPDHPGDPEALLATLREIVMSGRWTEGEYATSFERRVAEVCGSVYAVATNSGTSALESICAAIGLGTDSEVICPSYTFIATVNAVMTCGATPVFADIGPKTYNLDLNDVAAKVTKKTKAVVLVHQYGIPADGKAFLSFCRERNLVLIEDGACGLGSKYDGRSLGTFGLAGLLSFHPRKVVSTGEGGMVLTDQEEIAVRSRVFGNHGRSREAGGPATMVGHNYRMSEFQAALGLWAIDRLPEAVSRRKAAAKRYDDAIRTIDGIQTILEPGRGEWNRQSYPIRIKGQRRDRVAEELQKRGIETNPGPLPAHIHPYIVASLHPPRLSETEAAYDETLLLPMYAALSESDQEEVIRSIQDAVR